MSKFDERLVKKLYNKKKASCKERMIDFQFTLSGWIELYKLCYDDNGLTCAYTNQEFDFEGKDDRYKPTLERIHQDRGYSPENCLWVTGMANNLKERYIESGEDECKATPTERRYLTRIHRIISSEDNIKEIQKPYMHMFQEATDNTLTVNPEIEIAKLYVNLGEYFGRQCVEFQLTYVQFKNAITRKNCGLTGRELPEDLSSRRLWLKDKTLPVTKANILCTTKELQQSLDKLIKECNIEPKDLKRLGKALSK